MASMLRNLADKLEGKDKKVDNTHSSNTGLHHNTAANQADPRIDSHSGIGGYGNNQPTHAHGNTGVMGTSAQSTTTGPHNSDLANKLDPRVDSAQTGGYGTGHTTSHHTTGTGGYGTTTTTTSHHDTTTGPHSSNMANKLDPRVDSDLDGRNNPTSHLGGHGNTYSTTGATHPHTTTGAGHMGTNTQSTNVGPHSSNLMNKLDPRVDSDLDGRNNPTSHLGGHGNTYSTTGTSHGHTTTGAGHMGANTQSTNTTPHSSGLMNKLDPRVDSNVGGRTDHTSHVGGYGNTQTTGAGYGNTHTTTGHMGGNNQSTTTTPHSSGLMNKLDPRVDSNVGGRTDHTSHAGSYGNTHTTGAGYGNTHASTGHVGGNTQSTSTGPHSSGLMNKLDPRVDSNVGGRTDQTSGIGGYGSGNTHQTGYNTQTPPGYTNTSTNPTHHDQQSTTTGPHSSNLLNKLDPRVDTDRDGRSGGYGNTQDRVGRY